ncbi:MAG: undecaprenyl-diphosphate phosphatase [Candidatus Micrarchaeota archaeon]
MDFFEAMILGTIQGIAEWLPISSEAMVTLAGKFFFNAEYKEALGTAIWLHSGTTLSAIIYFRNDVIAIIKSIFSGERSLLFFLAIATLSTSLSAIPLLLLAFSIEFPDVLFTLFIGIFLLLISYLQKSKHLSKPDDSTTSKKAFISGIVQGFAVLPGVSRSGLSVAALLSQKFSLKESLRLSFLMSIPVTGGIQIFLPLVSDSFSVTAPLILGSLVACAVGLLTIKTLMEFAQRISFVRATFALGIIVILLAIVLAL